MIHAVAEGLALSWDQGASTAERLARESQRMDLSTNLALVRTTIARVCLCEYHYGGGGPTWFGLLLFVAPCWRRAFGFSGSAQLHRAHSCTVRSVQLCALSGAVASQL